MSALVPGVLSFLLDHQMRKILRRLAELFTPVFPFLWALVPFTVEDSSVPTTTEWVA